MWMFGHTAGTYRTELGYIYVGAVQERTVVFQTHDKRVDTSIVFMFVETKEQYFYLPDKR
jgi:hypothetical protein